MVKPAGASGRKGLVATVGVAVAATLLSFIPAHEGTLLKVYRDPIGIRTV